MSSVLFAENCLEAAIARHPLILSADASVVEAIVLMSAGRTTCALTCEVKPEPTWSFADSLAHCVLVVEASRLVGIFTERDALRLMASGQPLEQVAIADVMTHPVVALRDSDFVDLLVPLALFQKHHVRYLPIVDAQEQVVGLLTHDSWQQLLLRLQSASEVMTSQVVHAPPTASVADLVQLMATHRVGSVVIVEAAPLPSDSAKSATLERDRLMPLGIVTERDIVPLLALGLDLAEVEAQEVMSTPVFSVEPDASLRSVQALMQAQRISRVVVTDSQGQLLGIVTRSRLLNVLNPLEICKRVEALERKVSQLEAEKIALLQNRNLELEQQVQERTAALQAQTERERLLQRITQSIRQVLDVDEILDTAVTEVRRMLQADRTLIFHLRPDRSGIILKASTLAGLPAAEGLWQDECFPSDCYEYYCQGNPRIISDVSQDEWGCCLLQYMQDMQVKSKVVAPILQTGDDGAVQIWGLLIVHACSEPRQWQQVEAEFLQQIANQMAIAIQQATAYQQVQTELVERQRTEAILRRSEATNRAIMQAIPDLLIRLSADGQYIDFASGSAVNVLYPDGDVQNYGVHDVLHPDLAQRKLHYAQQAIATGKLQIYEQNLQVGSDTYYEEVRVVPNGDAEALLIIRDITERKQTEAALLKSEAQSRAILSAIPDFMFRVGADGTYREYVTNHRSIDVLPATVNAIGQKMADVLPPELAEQQMQRLQEALETGTLQVYEQQLQLGDRHQYEEVRVVKSAPDEVLFMIRDITERKQAEAALYQLNRDLEHRVEERTAALQQSEALLRAAQQVAHLGSWDLDLINGTVRWSREVFQIFGLDPDQPTPSYEHQSRYFHPEDWQRLDQAVGKAIREGEPYALDLRILREDGSLVYTFAKGQAVYNSEGQITRLIGIVMDITDRKYAEAALRESERRYATLAEAVPVAICRFDPDGNCIYVNDRWSEMTGRPTQTALGMGWLETLPPEDRDRVSTEWAQALLQNGFFQSESRCLRPDGSMAWFYAQVLPEIDSNGNIFGYVGTLTDITDRKRVEKKRQEAEIALRESQRFIQQIADASPNVLYLYDMQEQRNVYVNREIVNGLGYTPEEIEAMGTALLASIIHPDDLPRFLEHRAQLAIAQDDEVLDLDYLIRHADGTWRCFYSREAVFSRDQDGRVLRIIGMSQDISDRKYAEAALRESERRYATLAEAVPVAICRFDPDGNCIYVNDRWSEMTGRPIEAALGRQWVEALHPEDRDRILKDWAQAIAAGRGNQGEGRHLRPDGSIMWFYCQALPELDSDGTVLGYVGTLTDISDRKRIEEERKRAEADLRRSQAQYRAILEDQTELICRFLPEGTILYVNEAYCRFFQLQQEAVIGHSYEPIIFEADLERVAQQVSSISLEHPIVTIENRVVVAGEIRWTQWNNRAFFDDEGQLIEFQSVGRDITELKQAEAQLQQANHQLLRANAELARATRLKDEFLANMSHELRTPLNAILGLSEGLQEAVFGRLNDRQQQAIATIERSGRHLLELINDILEVSKIETGKFELDITAVSVKQLCSSSVAFVKQQATQKNIQLKTRIQANLREIPVDERRMRQVLLNLLNNAVKFTPPGGQVVLDVSLEFPQSCGRESDQKDNNSLPTAELSTWLCFSVTDTGIGIAAQDLEKLFQPFVQIDSRLNRQYTGTGLGLTLVKQIAELHGGNVTVASEPGQGSCFTVRLPYQSAVLKAAPSAVVAAGSVWLNNSRVLVIEDSISASEQMTRYLTELNLEAIVHPQGEGTVEEVLRIQPALIILDILLPNQSGWETLNQLKAHPQTQNIPVLVVSVVDERSRGLELGAVEYLVKPITRGQLRVVLEKLRYAGLPPAPAVTEVDQPSLESPLILLAEDNQANIDTLSNYLDSRGYRLVLARNGQEAIALAEAHVPDLIVMDIQMPHVDGLEAIRQIRVNPSLADIPIIALTALAMPQDRDKCLAAGANEYLAKPVKLKQLVTEIQQLLA